DPDQRVALSGRRDHLPDQSVHGGILSRGGRRPRARDRHRVDGGSRLPMCIAWARSGGGAVAPGEMTPGGGEAQARPAGVPDERSGAAPRPYGIVTVRVPRRGSGPLAWGVGSLQTRTPRTDP